MIFVGGSKLRYNHQKSYDFPGLTRFMVMITAKQTGILNDFGFRFVPAPPSGRFDHIYTDKELYEAFNLPQNYIDIIEAVIKERK